MREPVTQGRRPFLFIGLVFLLSVPLYCLGNLQVLPKSFHLYAPVFILASAIPLLLANLFLYRERGSGSVNAQWKNILGFRQIRSPIWYIPIFLTMPATLLVTYALTSLIGKPIPDPHFPILLVPLLFAVFFVFAVGEEAGWSGYVIDGLQRKWSALTSSIVVGVAWAAWHIIPFVQAHHSSTWWVVWQCAGTVSLRVLMVWIFNNTGKSIFAVVLFHAMINETEFMYPNLGSYYEPLIPFLILTAMAVMVVYLWGPKTLARYRFTPPNAAAFVGS
jgi:uncharacterized protein